MRRWMNFAAWLLLFGTLAGCAHVAVESDGTRHITGLVKITLRPAVLEVGADAVRMQTFGLTLVSGHSAAAQASLGYSDTTLVIMRNDAAVSHTALRRVLQNEQHQKGH